ncbi:MAG: radical SAM protein [Marinilabiliales bacterium]|nr:MAG: radical SAM protein [Marinilabiliales bacterium]
MYKYLFGPVPSRRLGMSLGIDLVPRKVCSLDCVYCEVGETTKLTLERNEYILYDKVVAELKHYFDNNPDPYYFTFSGSGEPTLNSRIGEVIDFVKERKPNVKVAVLTNGTIFSNPDVRNTLLNADLVLPSLDAVDEDAFQKINRPAKGLTAKDCVDGLVKFIKDFKGIVWLEIFILPGYNDSEENLLKLKEAVHEINPDLVQLNTLDRPGTIDGLFPASIEELEEVIKVIDFPNTKIIARAPKRKEQKSYRQDAESAIIGTIARRPCTAQDLSDILGMHISEVNKYLDVLEADGKIQVTRQERGVFYSVVGPV